MLSDQAMQVIREALTIVRRANEYELAIVQNEDAWNAVVNDVEKRNAEIDAALAELGAMKEPTVPSEVRQAIKIIAEAYHRRGGLMIPYQRVMTWLAEQEATDAQ